MSARLTIVVAAVAALGAASVAIGASQAAPAPGAQLDYEMFKTRVLPVFLKKREGHARCYQCHVEANNFLRLERLAPGQTAYTDEQSRKMFESISKLVTPANRANSRLLIHPLAPEAGGDLFHSGGRQFDSRTDPDFRILAQWAGSPN